jgi:hypothetical protein
MWDLAKKTDKQSIDQVWMKEISRYINDIILLEQHVYLFFMK